MKTCEEYELAISCYVDDALKSADQPELFRHLGECGKCREFLEASIRIHVETTREERYALAGGNAIRSNGATAPSASMMRRLLEMTHTRVAIPLPVAAVGLTLLIVAGALLLKPQQTMEMTRTEKAVQTQTVMSMPTIVISQ